MVLGMLIALLLVRVSTLGAAAPHRRARARVGDAAGGGGPGLELDDEHPERRPQLRPDRAARRQLLPAQLVRDPDLAARDGHDARSSGARSPSSRSRSTRRSRRCRTSSSRRRRSTARAPWRVFKDVTLPVLKPVLLILTSLSILWDFGVFTQPYLLIGAVADHAVELPHGRLPLVEAFVKTDFGLGAAISILMLVIVALAERRLRAQDAPRWVRWRERRRRPRNSAGTRSACSSSP